jgi:hypothetical protein
VKFQVLKAAIMKMRALWNNSAVSEEHTASIIRPSFIALMMKAVRTSGTSTYFNETILR